MTGQPVTRIEWFGTLRVDQPVKQPWWAPHAGPDCNVFTRPRADCDCGAEVPC